MSNILMADIKAQPQDDLLATSSGDVTRTVSRASTGRLSTPLDKDTHESILDAAGHVEKDPFAGGDVDFRTVGWIKGEC